MVQRAGRVPCTSSTYTEAARLEPSFLSSVHLIAFLDPSRTQVLVPETLVPESNHGGGLAVVGVGLFGLQLGGGKSRG